jgi:hypothetical protein
MVGVVHFHVAYPTVMEKRADTDVTLRRTSGKQHCQHGAPAASPSDSCSTVPHWPAGNDTLPLIPFKMRMVCAAKIRKHGATIFGMRETQCVFLQRGIDIVFECVSDTWQERGGKIRWQRRICGGSSDRRLSQRCHPRYRAN